MLATLLRSRSMHLFLSLVGLMLIHPVEGLLPDPWGGRLTTLMFIAVMLAAVWWTSPAARHRIVPLVLVAPAIISYWLRSDLGPLAALAWVMFLVYVIARLFGAVFSRTVDLTDRLIVALSVYLLIAITFSSIYHELYQYDPSSFRLPGPVGGEGVRAGVEEMLYFSMVTMLTLGYGDIVPVNGFARMLAVFEGFIGAFFIAILIARLISLPEPKAATGEGPRQE